MASVKEHYENLLAANYLWAFGDHETNAAKFKAGFARFGIKPEDGALAIDLGCGPGYQALALADLGFDVLAIDSSRYLLDELEHRRGDRRITIVEDDALNFQAHCADRNVSLIICVGGVLTHLKSIGDVTELFGKTFDALSSGGKLLLGFRDLSVERKGADRLLPFHSDENKIMTTFLEYGMEFVNVTDVIYARTGAGWTLEKSEYRKPRLGADKVGQLLERTGFEAVYSDINEGFT